MSRPEAVTEAGCHWTPRANQPSVSASMASMTPSRARPLTRKPRAAVKGGPADPAVFALVGPVSPVGVVVSAPAAGGQAVSVVGFAGPSVPDGALPIQAGGIRDGLGLTLGRDFEFDFVVDSTSPPA